MTRNVATVNSSEPVLHAAHIMRDRERAALVVLEDGEPVGIITERDLVRRVLANSLDLGQTKVSEVMSRPLVSVSPDASIGEVARIMVDNRLRRLPIVEEGRLVGMVTAVDLARYLSKVTHELGGEVNWMGTLWDAILRAAAGT